MSDPQQASDFIIPSQCEICCTIPNHAHGDFLPGSEDELPTAVYQLQHGDKPVTIPGSSVQWILHCPRCHTQYYFKSETGAWEYDVYVTRMIPSTALKKGLIEQNSYQALIALLPQDLTHANPEFRSYAAASLTRHYLLPEFWNPDQVITLLKAKDDSTRSAAVEELPKTQIDPFVATLIDLLWDPSWQIHEAALRHFDLRRDRAQTMENLALGGQMLLDAIARRPLTYNVIRLLLVIEQMRLDEVSITPLIAKLLDFLAEEGQYAGYYADVQQILTNYIQYNTANAKQFLQAWEHSSLKMRPLSYKPLHEMALAGVNEGNNG